MWFLGWDFTLELIQVVHNNIFMLPQGIHMFLAEKWFQQIFIAFRIMMLCKRIWTFSAVCFLFFSSFCLVYIHIIYITQLFFFSQQFCVSKDIWGNGFSVMPKDTYKCVRSQDQATDLLIRRWPLKHLSRGRPSGSGGFCAYLVISNILFNALSEIHYQMNFGSCLIHSLMVLMTL